MALQVSMIHSHVDAGTWPEYLQSQIADHDTVDTTPFLITDEILFGTPDSRTETRIMKSKVVLVVLTPGHVDYLQANKRASYKRLVDSGNKGILLLLGFSETEFEESTIVKKFPECEKWSKVIYEDNDSIKEMLLKIVETLEQPESLKCGFTVLPTVLQCQEETTVSLMIDEPIPPKSKVTAIIKGNDVDAKVPARRINPHCYSAVMPVSVEGEAAIFIDLDGHSLGSQFKVKYIPSLHVESVVAISAIYCHCMDILCKIASGKTTLKQEDIDGKISEIFDYMVDLPIQGFENIFGMYQYCHCESSRTEIPSLVHLAAKYDLKETFARLEDLPQYSKVSEITNKNGKRPQEIAEQRGHKELANHIREMEEKMELYLSYADMLHYTKSDAIQKSGPNYVNNQKQRSFDEPEEYSEMELAAPGSAAHPDDPSEHYLPMDGAAMSSRGAQTKAPSDAAKAPSDSDGEYEGVEDWCDENKDPTDYDYDLELLEMEDMYMDMAGIKFDQSAAAAPESPLSPLAPGDHHQGLIELNKNVRDGKMSIEQALEQFKDWKQTQKTGSPNSFKNKQEMLKEASIMDKIFRRTKKADSKASRSKQEASVAKKSSRTQSFTKSKKEAALAPTPESYLPKVTEKPAQEEMPPKNVYREENPYASREPPAPPPPSRGPVSGVSRQALPKVPHRAGREELQEPELYLDMTDLQEPELYLDMTGEAQDPNELYLSMGGGPDEDYMYVEQELARPDPPGYPPSDTHNHPLPPVPGGGQATRTEGLYLDDRASARLGRLSGSSSGSRASNMSTGSGRDSTASQLSSGIDSIHWRSEDDIPEEDDLLCPYDTVVMTRSRMVTEAEGCGSRDSGLERICEGDVDEHGYLRKRGEDYDARNAKRMSIQDKDLPEPPAVPHRRQTGKPLPTPAPRTPDTPDFRENSIPLEAPPPIPSASSLERVPEERPEPSEEERRQAFLQKIGATGTSYIGGHMLGGAKTPPQKPLKKPPPTARKPSDAGPRPPPKPSQR